MKSYVQKIFVFCVAIFLLKTLSGCALTAKDRLKKYLGNYDGYELIEVPRDFDGTGTIIQYRDGKEIPIASPKDCFPTDDVTRTVGDAELFSYDEKDGFDMDFGLNLIKLQGIATKLKANNVNKILVKFNKVEIEKLPYIRIEKHIENRKLNPMFRSCLRHIDKDDIVLVDMLKGNVSYEFIKEDSLKFELTPPVLKELGVNLGTDYNAEGKYTLKSNEPLYFAYKAVRLVSKIMSDGVKIKGTIQETNKISEPDVIIEHENLTLEDIEELKARSK